jgi:hypothetical protein
VSTLHTPSTTKWRTLLKWQMTLYIMSMTSSELAKTNLAFKSLCSTFTFFLIVTFAFVSHKHVASSLLPTTRFPFAHQSYAAEHHWSRWKQYVAPDHFSRHHICIMSFQWVFTVVAHSGEGSWIREDRVLSSLSPFSAFSLDIPVSDSCSIMAHRDRWQPFIFWCYVLS